MPSVQIVDGDEVIDEGYSYADLTIIRLIRAIRDKKLNLRSASIALRHLIDRFGSPDRGWSEIHVYIVNNNVYADKLDEWEVTQATQYGQRVETRLFDDVFNILRDMDEDGDILLPPGFSQCIEINPKVMGGEPVIKNTRVPVAAIAAKYRKGSTIEHLVNLYTPISRLCIEKAIDYEEYLNSPVAKTREAVTGR
jgi:uncharacterized protein (DUF433 family)